jgi:hypothetical protein
MNEITKEPYLVKVTQRETEDEWHLKCRMSDGQKGAFVKVDIDFPELADKIEDFLRSICKKEEWDENYN